MPYVRVHVDISDIMDELETEDLQKELKRRNKFKEQPLTPISDGEKSMKLRDAALELRRVGKISNAVWLEDIAAEMEME